MDVAYKIMFFAGVLYTFISLVISGMSEALHLGSHIGHMHGDAGGHIHGHSNDMHGHHADSSAHGVEPSEVLLSWFSILINPIVAVSFFTVFGGMGILGTEYFHWMAVNVFLIAFVSGSVTAFLLYRFIAIPLYKAENSTDVSRGDLAGTPAEVISAILEDGFGKIQYTVNSIRYTAPARHIEHKAVIQGKKVVICKIEENIFYVTEIDEL